MIEACQMQHPMHHKMGGVVQNGLLLLRGFAGDGFEGERNVSEKRRPRGVFERSNDGRRWKGEHVCGGVLSAECLVERTHLRVGQQRYAYRMRFRGKFDRP